VLDENETGLCLAAGIFGISDDEASGFTSVSLGNPDFGIFSTSDVFATTRWLEASCGISFSLNVTVS
jgi:hypothetical protein